MNFLAREAIEIGVGQSPGFRQNASKWVVNVFGHCELQAVNQHCHIPICIGLIKGVLGGDRGMIRPR